MRSQSFRFPQISMYCSSAHNDGHVNRINLHNAGLTDDQFFSFQQFFFGHSAKRWKNVEIQTGFYSAGGAFTALIRFGNAGWIELDYSFKQKPDTRCLVITLYGDALDRAEKLQTLHQMMYPQLELPLEIAQLEA
ncbi:MAG: hypothetical protein UZ21_OP11001001020 [Microgenomates bacterium OLB22]|nr:MAG: hypothetical protein UZ21_OP11001001020 [Microgenomates bacterium OLB22]